jgi:penicillin amidase
MLRNVLFTVILLSLVLLPASPGIAQTNEDFSVPGLEATVQVVFDQMGIPHIYADNEHDLFMAQGYVHAADRWWQLEWWRHMSAGRLAEIGGSMFAGSDQFIRTLDYQGAAETDWEAISEETQTLLQAYADGVNAYIVDKSPSELAVQYDLLAENGIDIEVEPWTVYDSLRWGKVMTQNLSGNFEIELIRAELIEVMSPIVTRIIIPDYDFDNYPVIVQPGGIDYQGERDSTAAAIEELDYSGVNFDLVGNVSLDDPWLHPFGSDLGVGSNSWVVSGDMTDHGFSMVANDPHLGIQMPSVWYENGLHCEACGYNVVGVSLASAPGVVIGHNDHISWGFTNVGTDSQDLYILTINPENPDQYLLDDEWRDFDVRTETIEVASSENREITIRESYWGPVISDLTPDDDQVLALRWVGFDGDRNAEVLLHYNRATNWEEFREAASMYGSAGQNAIYADVEGNIGYQMTGLVPIRVEGHDGRVPVDGSTTDKAWQGFVPWDEIPSIYNPEAGYIVTANNAVVPEDYPYYITDVWAYGFRAARIEDMIQDDADGVITIEDMQRIHGDNHDPSSDYVIPALQSLEIETETLAEIVEWLGGWDRQNHKDSPQAAFYNVYWGELLRLMMEDDLGFAPDGNTLFVYLMSQFLNSNTFPLWDNQSTDVTETRDDILLEALVNAWNKTITLLGPDRETWRWGDLHMANFVSLPFGLPAYTEADEVLDEQLNIRVQASGGTTSVNATSYNAGLSYELVSLPSMRQLTVVGDWDSSMRINTTGQSAHPDSPHYRDQAPLWSDIEYHPEWFSREAVMGDASVIWDLTPME